MTTTDNASQGDDKIRAQGGRWRAPILLAAASIAVILPALIGFRMLTGDVVNSAADPLLRREDTADSPLARVAPFREILVGTVMIEIDPTGTRAELSLTTSVEAICAVTFGATPDLGTLTADSAMGTGLMTEHRPVLTGLQPGEEYLYRLHAITADGTIYISDPVTLTVPMSGEGVDDTDGASRIIGASIVDVSSEYSAGYTAANAVDGDPLTEWSSAGDGDDAFIVIDLGEPMEVTGLRFRTRSMADGTAITSTYTVTVDNRETFGPFDTRNAQTAEVSFIGQIIRFDVETSTGGNTGAVEVEVFGTVGAASVPSTSEPPPRLPPRLTTACSCS